MSDQNKAIARQFLAAFAAGDTTVLTRIVAENLVDHNASPGTKPGRQGLLDAVTMFRVGFPDIEISADRVVAEGNTVAVYGMIRGTNNGPLMGAPATGKRAVFSYMDMYLIASGQITEVWHVENIAGMLAQLGPAQR
jgi:steroid delta-isomerase-like uncharacterized protein